MGPLDQAIKRAAVLLANIHASRREAIPRIEPVKAIRDEEQFATRMGMSSECFRQQVVNHALMRTDEHGRGGATESHDLENTLLKILG
jgi:hypothetical protein